MLGDRSEESLHLKACELEAVQPVQRVRINRDGHNKLPIHTDSHAMLIWTPGCKVRKTLEYFFGISVKDMRAVLENKNPRVVIAVVRISADMWAAVYD